MAEKRQSVNNDISKDNKNDSSSKCLTTFTSFDMFCVFFSMGTFVADLITDIILVIEYWRKDHLFWSIGTFLLILVPAILIQLFSMRWHLMDEAVSLWHWITHICLIGVLHRYTILLKTGFEARESKSPHDVQRLNLQQSDICMLHLFESFLEAAPQLVLQLYIMVVMRDWHILTVISATASLCSLSWAIVSYVSALRRARSGACETTNVRGKPLSLALQATWRGGMLAARIAALLMFAVTFQHWTFLFLGIHWLIMTAWVMQQKTDFCPSRPEEIFYNCIVGVIYCFCFFNLREGQARYRMITFYTILVSQNIICLLLFLFISPNVMRKELIILSSVIIMSGTFLGLSSMLIYYRWLHPGGPIRWWNDPKDTLPSETTLEIPIDSGYPKQEEANTSAANLTMRSLKSTWHETSDKPTKCTNQPPSIEHSPQSDTECTDKKVLLDHWIARAGSPTFASVPIDNIENPDVTGIEFYSVVNTPEKSKNITDKSGILNASFQLETEISIRQNNELSKENVFNASIKNKRRGICSPTELGVKFSKMEQNDSCLENMVDGNEVTETNVQKRRGICSSGQLKEEMAQGVTLEILPSLSDSSEGDFDRSNQKTSSDSLNLDLDLSFSDINSSDINEFNENIVQKLCLSTLKNIKNVHQDADIRNIQKIALEILKDLYSKGGVKDDQDLESELSSSVGRDLETPSEVLSAHDYENICAVNIAREAWGLRSWRACSDMGGSPPPPPPLPQRRPSLSSPHTNYIRTVAYELAKCEDSNCQLMKTPEYHKEPDSSVFIAKPYVIDQNDGIFPIATPLEPILEELDEIIDNSGTIRRRQRHSSESALVATIDEIRIDTVTDSPRNVYHRGDWDSPCLNFDSEKKYEPVKKCNFSNLKKVLWKDEAVEENRQYQNDNIDPKKQHSEIETNRLYNVIDTNTLHSIVKHGSVDSLIKSDICSHKLPNDVFQVKFESDCNKYEIQNKQKLGKNNCVSKKTNSPKVHFQKKEKQLFKYNTSADFMQKSFPNNQQLKKKDSPFLSTVNMDSSLSSKNKNKLDNADCPTFGISSSLQSLIDKDSQSCLSIPKMTIESRPSNKRNSSNRPRRKFSLLREKFEPKSKHSDEEMLFQSLESVRSLIHNELDNNSSRTTLKNNSNLMLVNQEPKIRYDKENLTPIVSSIRRVVTSIPNDQVVLSLSPCDTAVTQEPTKNLKEKQSIFLKQVLGPPKLNSWNKKNVNEIIN